MTETSRRQNVLICLCLTTAIMAVYWPVNHFGFTSYDDPQYVTENRQVQSGLTLKALVWAFTTHDASNWHPLTWLSHMLDWQLWGGNAGTHHLVNVFLHIANTLLLFCVLRRMTSAPWRSALVAALFALHPLHVESVAWVSERKDVLSAFFWMLTMWAYVRYVEQFTVQPFDKLPSAGLRAGRAGSSRFTVSRSPLPASRSTLHVFYTLTLLFFTLGLMSKPMVVTLPFVLLLLDYWPLGRTRWARPAPIRSGPATGERVETSLSQLLKEKLPFFALAAASCVVTLWAQRSAVSSLERLPVGDRLANAVVSCARYFGKAVWPRALAAFYPYQKWPTEVVVEAGAVLLGVSAWVIWRARREPQFVMGWLWYLGTLVPVIGLVQVGGQSMADRYAYLPLIGLFIMVAWAVPCGVAEQRERKLVAAATAAALLGFCAVLCGLQVRYWRNSETLYRHALEVTTSNWVAHNGLGLALLQGDRVEEAISHFEWALRINPSYAEAQYNLGSALTRLGRLQEAIGHYEQALRLKPDYANAHNDLGVTLQRAGKLPEAIGHYEQALRLKPDYAEGHNNLGVALQRTGKLPEAIGHYEQALRLKPDSADAHSNLGVALQQTGKLQEAIGHYEQALRLKPNSADAHNKLGNALLQAGKLKAAVEQYEQALRIAPDLVEAQNNLAWLLATLAPPEGGDPVRAVNLAERVCKLTDNRMATYLDTLAVGYAAAGRFNDAIATAQKAVELACSDGQTQLVGQIQMRLDRYRSGGAHR